MLQNEAKKKQTPLAHTFPSKPEGNEQHCLFLQHTYEVTLGLECPEVAYFC